MSAAARFFPGICPDCGDPIAVPYSRYSRARANPLYVPLLVADFALAILLVGVAFWAVAHVTDALAAGRGLKLKERGVIYFGIVSAVASCVIWGAVRFAKLLGRLPRRFEYECGGCRRVSQVGVVVGGLAEDAGLTARVVEVSESGPFAAMRDRRDHREQVRRRGEQDDPPNPEFDFRPRV